MQMAVQIYKKICNEKHNLKNNLFLLKKSEFISFVNEKLR